MLILKGRMPLGQAVSTASTIYSMQHVNGISLHLCIYFLFCVFLAQGPQNPTGNELAAAAFCPEQAADSGSAKFFIWRRPRPSQTELVRARIKSRKLP